MLASVATDFFQERDARNAAEKLKQAVKSKVTVIRSGTEEDILAQDLCTRRYYFIERGQNCFLLTQRVIMAKDFFINQSSLTGESFLVKNILIRSLATRVISV
ncbi:MAG: hypothetical protein WDO19_26670 [Bacteroidota bacterium]